jgi:dihydrofolate reductase
LITLVVARARNGVIGRDGSLPWRLPDDLRRFKALTLGKPVLMGRRTFASIGRPLPGRRNLVLSRDATFRAEGVEVVQSLEEAIDLAGRDTELMVIGGGEVYRLALPHATRIELTDVDAEVEGDATFPELDAATWRVVATSSRPADARHTHAMRFVTLVRV